MKYLNWYAGWFNDKVPGVTLEKMPVNSNCVKGVADGHWFVAKVFMHPSEDYGINGGRISKLCISKSDKWDGFFPTLILFNYDCGLDIGKVSNRTVQKILRCFPVTDEKEGKAL